MGRPVPALPPRHPARTRAGVPNWGSCSGRKQFPEFALAEFPDIHPEVFALGDRHALDCQLPVKNFGGSIGFGSSFFHIRGFFQRGSCSFQVNQPANTTAIIQRNIVKKLDNEIPDP